MDTKMDINVVASGGFPWSPLEHRGVENSTRINDLRCLLDFLRIPWNDAVERVKELDFGFYRVFVRYGFKDDPDIPAALAMCADQGLPFELMESSFFLGRETLIPRKTSPLTLWRDRLFILMFRNAHSAADFFSIPPNRVVEFGTQVEL